MADAQEMTGGLASIPPEAVNPVEEKMQEYAKARIDLINQQKALIDSLQARVSQPADKLMAMSQAFLTPGRTGSFGEAAGNVMGMMRKSEEEEDARRMELAKMRLALGQQQLGLSKEDIELARQQQEAKAVNQILSGGAPVGGQMPAGQPSQEVSQAQSIYAKMTPQQQALVRTMKPDDARKFLLEIAKKDLEPSEEERKYRFWMSQFPAEQQPLVQNIFRNKAVLGDAQGIAKSIIDINAAYRTGVIKENTRDQLLSMVSTIGGQAQAIAPPAAPPAAPAAAPAAIVRETAPTDEQARARALSLSAQGVPFSIQGPEAKRPEAPSGITPETQEKIAGEVAKKRAEMDLEEEKRLKGLADDAEDAIRDSNQFIRIAKETPTAFGRFSSPSVSNAITNILAGGVTLPFGMGIKVPELKQALINYGANEKEVNAMQMIDFMSIKQQLALGQMMKGSVSNFERELVGKATISKEDTANTALFKASIIRARALLNKQLWELYRKEGRASGMSVDDFKDENPKALKLKQDYDNHLRMIDDRFGAR